MSLKVTLPSSSLLSSISVFPRAVATPPQVFSFLALLLLVRLPFCSSTSLCLPLLYIICVVSLPPSFFSTSHPSPVVSEMRWRAYLQQTSCSALRAKCYTEGVRENHREREMRKSLIWFLPSFLSCCQPLILYYPHQSIHQFNLQSFYISPSIQPRDSIYQKRSSLSAMQH